MWDYAYVTAQSTGHIFNQQWQTFNGSSCFDFMIDFLSNAFLCNFILKVFGTLGPQNQENSSIMKEWKGQTCCTVDNSRL